MLPVDGESRDSLSPTLMLSTSSYSFESKGLQVGCLVLQGPFFLFILFKCFHEPSFWYSIWFLIFPWRSVSECLSSQEPGPNRAPVHRVASAHGSFFAQKNQTGTLLMTKLKATLLFLRNTVLDDITNPNYGGLKLALGAIVREPDAFHWQQRLLRYNPQIYPQRMGGDTWAFAGSL